MSTSSLADDVTQYINQLDALLSAHDVEIEKIRMAMEQDEIDLAAIGIEAL